MSQEQELVSKIKELKKSSHIVTYSMSYTDFKDKYMILVNELGDEATVMFSENIGVLSFHKFSLIRFVIKKKFNFIQSDFVLEGVNFKIIGTREKFRTSSILKNDIKNNWKKIVTIIIIYFCLFNFFDINYESISKLNDTLINVANIFIASFFVFIAFFNSDKSKVIELYKKGVFDKYNRNDRYIFQMSLVSLVLCIISNGIIAFKVPKVSFFINIKDYIKSYIGVTIYNYIRYNISFFLTGISIIILIICFDSILNYYFKKMRNNYFIEAFDKIIDENEIEK